MAPAPTFPRTVARAALLGIAATVTLSACGQSEGSITTVRASTPAMNTATATGTPSPAASSASTKPAPSPSKDSPGDKEADRTSNATPVVKKTVASDVSQLKSLGINLNVGVLIDVADDGRDAYLEIGEGGIVDFTGSSKTDNTMMALKPAQVAKRTESTKNQVVLAPPFYNEDLGAGSCIADTAAGKLRLATCKAGAANQTWHAIPAGDSGQFELHGVHTKIRVNNGKIITSGQGYVGLQTIKFAD